MLDKLEQLIVEESEPFRQLGAGAARGCQMGPHRMYAFRMVLCIYLQPDE